MIRNILVSLFILLSLVACGGGNTSTTDSSLSSTPPATTPPVVTQAESWQQTNGPTGSRISTLAINNSSQTLYAGTADGIYKSVVGSNSWRLVAIPNG